MNHATVWYFNENDATVCSTSEKEKGHLAAMLCTSAADSETIATLMKIYGMPFVKGHGANFVPWDQNEFISKGTFLEELGMSGFQIQHMWKDITNGANESEIQEQIDLNLEDLAVAMGVESLSKDEAREEFKVSSWQIGHEARRLLIKNGGCKDLDLGTAIERMIEAVASERTPCRLSNDYLWDGERFKTMFWIFDNENAASRNEPSEMFEVPLLAALAVVLDENVGTTCEPLRLYMGTRLTEADRFTLKKVFNVAKEKGLTIESIFGGMLVNKKCDKEPKQEKPAMPRGPRMC